MIVATIVLSCAMVCFSFSPSLPVSQRLSPLKMSADSNIQSKISKIMSTTFIAAAMIGPPILVFTPVQSVHADVRAQQKRTYFRFVPKLIIGKDFYAKEVKNAIDKEDWPVVTKFFEEFVSKYNPNDPSQIDSTDSYVNVNVYRPMKVFSGSFAERGQSPKNTALLNQELAFEKAMKGLEGSIKDMKGDGFFAADIKMPTGDAKKIQALASWEEGKTAINEYIRIGNDGLMLELNKIEPI